MSAAGLLARIEAVSITIASDQPGSSPRTHHLTANATEWTTRFGGLETGATYTIRAEAFDGAGALRFQTDPEVPVAVTLTPDHPSPSIVLVLLELAPDAGPTLYAPTFHAILIGGSHVEPGGTLAIEVQGSDTDSRPGETLTLRGSGGDGSWSAPVALDGNPGTGLLSWSAGPTPGPTDLLLTLEDAAGNGTSVAVTVRVGDPAHEVTTRFVVNHAPRISSIAVGALPDGVLELTAIASDDHDAPLSFRWSATCGGSFDSSATPTVLWSRGSPAPQPPCTFAVTVADAYGLETTGSLVIYLDDPSTNYAPALVWEMQSHVVAIPGATMEFAAIAQGLPAADGSSIGWSWSVGGVAPAEDAFPGSTVSPHVAHGYAGSRLSLRIADGGVVCTEDERLVPGDTTPTRGRFIDIELTGTANGLSDTETFSVYVPDDQREAICSG